ncbi:hypothetical protein MI149_29800 (plasmid) [Mycolicibacterium crocinum]|uniref:Uncharacterized protein n=1 Tax=Mycolicibacterium crocinum TaxID=388459 RepID=A0ABY3U028_9MYCO|nr:hypothetical protein [Mycolicibacterium crocinum]ULN44691.1 hypothetical protein MI149_29800 [Mycolicibacterium crocinum]
MNQGSSRKIALDGALRAAAATAVMSHDDCDSLARLKNLPASNRHRTRLHRPPGWIDLNASDDPADPLGTGPTADALRAVLDVADQVIMPIETEPLNSSTPTGGRWRTPVVRHDTLHSRARADGQVVTEYPVNRVALQAREDFYRFALELSIGGGC